MVLIEWTTTTPAPSALVPRGKLHRVGALTERAAAYRMRVRDCVVVTGPPAERAARRVRLPSEHFDCSPRTEADRVILGEFPPHAHGEARNTDNVRMVGADRDEERGRA
jgi:hypothetical protein